ncbi:putative sds3-like [Lyophyllum shimeji]|uniref:Sds3-like n=1 Tax=Lyophyllum shimeji TaxID=47721 RepID=A0A9P3PXG6_LYOSH|nr:putative sds3-like [Lyophyllum shimeji]
MCTSPARHLNPEAGLQRSSADLFDVDVVSLVLLRLPPTDNVNNAPQPGLFPIHTIHASSSHAHHIHTAHTSHTPHTSHSHGGSSHFKPPPGVPDIYSHQQNHQTTTSSSSRIHAHTTTLTHHGSMEDGKKEKRRRELAGKLGKEMSDRRDDGRHYHETIASLHAAAHQLSTRPETVALFMLRMMPLTLERGALLAQAEWEERHGLECAQMAYDEERERVEEEWRRGRERVRERLLEGVEERRRRAREEKEGEGTTGDPSLDSASRPHITRKLRNKLGTSPPPTPLGGSTTALPTPGLISSLPITSGPFLNPHSLAVDELPSPFPLPLTSTTAPKTADGGGGGRRRPKGNGGGGQQMVGGLGKSLYMLSGCKEGEVESDLNEIRRGNKRRRATAVALGKLAVS